MHAIGCSCVVGSPLWTAAAELLDPELARFDLKRLAAALKPERDLQFDYLGLQTLYD